MESFSIEKTLTKEERYIYGEEKIIITNFRKCSIFNGKKSKIIHRKGPEKFLIESFTSKIDIDPIEGPDVNDDCETSYVVGQDSVSIIDTIIRSSLKKGATIVWSGIHYEPVQPSSNMVDYVIDEMARKELREKGEI